jgi:hypothetical protein
VPSRERRALTVRELAWLAPVLLLPLVFAGMYAGDGVLHLAFAESAAAGRFFELEPGEPVAGETSPGFMLLVALLIRILGLAATPLAVQTLGYLVWWLLILVVWRVALALLGDRRWALAAASAAGLVPGSAYNSVVGMESAWFALAVWGAIASSALAPRGAAGFQGGVQAGGLLGMGCWLRPEGLVVAGLWTLAEAGEGRRTRALAGGAVAALLAAAALWFHHAHTGHWLPVSGRARVLAAHLGSWRLGPLLFDPTPAGRLLAYLPLAVGMVLGMRGLGAEGRGRGVWRLLAAMALVFLALYSTLLGAAHFGRYAVFLMPAIVLLATRGWRRTMAEGAGAADSWRGFVRRQVPTAVLWLLAVFAVEATLRARSASHRMVALLRQAPAERAAATDRLLAELQHPPTPVVVALVEVQLRYYVDRRVVVRSLDGRVDPRLLDFARRDGVDYLGYLRAREVDAVLGLPEDGALEPLRALAPGAELTLDGLRFRRVGVVPRFLVEPIGDGEAR